MESILSFLKDLSASQRLMWLGNAGMAISGISTGFFGIQVAAGMHVYVFGVSAVMSILGWYGSQQDQKRRFDLKMEDAKLRESKIAAGLDPALDKTIIQIKED